MASAAAVEARAREAREARKETVLAQQRERAMVSQLEGLQAKLDRERLKAEIAHSAAAKARKAA